MNKVKDLKNINISEQISNIHEIVTAFLHSYNEKNSWKIRMIDTFIVFCFIIFVIQLVYAFLIGMFPLNAVLSGIMCSIGTITLTVALRLQINDSSKTDNYSNETIFAEYLIASLLLYFVCINFVG